MRLHLRVHFDGRVLVPDQPVDLPVNQPLLVEVTTASPAQVNGAPPVLWTGPRVPGWGKGIITHVSPDFDEPLPDFREYTG